MSFAKEVAMAINLCCLNTKWKISCSLSWKKLIGRDTLLILTVMFNIPLLQSRDRGLLRYPKAMHTTVSKSARRDNFAPLIFLSWELPSSLTNPNMLK